MGPWEFLFVVSATYLILASGFMVVSSFQAGRERDRRVKAWTRDVLEAQKKRKKM